MVPVDLQLADGFLRSKFPYFRRICQTSDFFENCFESNMVSEGKLKIEWTNLLVYLEELRVLLE